MIFSAKIFFKKTVSILVFLSLATILFSGGVRDFGMNCCQVAPDYNDVFFVTPNVGFIYASDGTILQPLCTSVHSG